MSTNLNRILKNKKNLETIKQFLLEMDPIDKDLERGFESWFTEDNTYWEAIRFGSSIIFTCEEMIIEKILDFKDRTEFLYAQVLQNTDLRDLLGNIFSSEEISKEDKKLLLFFLTPIWKTLGTFWNSLYKEENSFRAETVIRIIMEDERKLMELIRKGSWENMLKMYRNPPKLRDAAVNKNRNSVLIIIAVVIIALIILSSTH